MILDGDAYECMFYIRFPSFRPLFFTEYRRTIDEDDDGSSEFITRVSAKRSRVFVLFRTARDGYIFTWTRQREVPSHAPRLAGSLRGVWGEEGGGGG